MKELALHGRALDDGALVAGEAVEPAARRRGWSAGRPRPGDLPAATHDPFRRSSSPSSISISSISSTNSGLPSAASRIRARLVREVGFAEEVLQQELALAGFERLEQHRCGVQLAASPGGTHVQELGPGETDEQDRRVAGEVGDMVDQVEEASARPSAHRRRRRQAAARAPLLRTVAALARRRAPRVRTHRTAGACAPDASPPHPARPAPRRGRPERDPVPVGEAAPVTTFASASSRP